MKKLIWNLICSIFSFGLFAADSFKGNADTWFLYLTDNFDSQSVIEVYAQNSCEDVSDVEPLYIAYGIEIDAEQCQQAGRCCIERVIRNGEVIAERVIEDGDVTRKYPIGDTLLQNIGLNAEYQKAQWKAKIDGDFRYQYLDSRTLYGSKDYRLHLTDLYVETTTKISENNFMFRAGRQSVFGGVLIDGLRSDWLWDAEGNKSLGLFAGLAPDHRTKHLDLDRIGFGTNFHFVPQFASASKVKLLFDATLYGEVFETKKMNRFSLFTRSHFTPVPELSLFHYSTLELPVPGEDSSFGSSYFSLRAFYRPHRKWIFSAGFSQFRISRYLQEESVKWATDPDSQQQDRVGDTLDRSQRYRVDARASYRPIHFVQPYLEGRYERRSFESNKKFLNEIPGSQDELPDENLSLLNRKNAYGGSTGFRLFPFADWETDSRFSYNNRFQSKSYDVLQEVLWSPNLKWSADAYFQIIWSRRDMLSSLPSGESREAKTLDYYAGLGGTYRIRSDLFTQIRYDFACEEDDPLETNILIHSVLLRMDYRF